MEAQVEIFEKLADPSGPMVLITVVETKGSSPGKPGFKMLVLPGGKTLGTVGGGSVELEAIRDCREVLESGELLLKEYGLTEDTSGMWCGGAMKLLFEPFLPPANLWIFGFGHVGREVFRIASGTGLSPRVVHNEEIHGVPVFVTDWETSEPFPEVRPEDFVLVLTMHTESEMATVLRLADTPPRYLGVIGSKAKAKKMREVLKENGQDPEKLNLHMPVGLSIGARTAGEIAVSIVAELIKELHGA